MNPPAYRWIALVAGTLVAGGCASRRAGRVPAAPDPAVAGVAAEPAPAAPVEPVTPVLTGPTVVVLPNPAPNPAPVPAPTSAPGPGMSEPPFPASATYSDLRLEFREVPDPYLRRIESTLRSSPARRNPVLVEAGPGVVVWRVARREDAVDLGDELRDRLPFGERVPFVIDRRAADHWIVTFTQGFR